MTDPIADPTETATALTIQDLQNLLLIIDAAAERGAFKGNELSAVGVTRDKLANFLEGAVKVEEDSKNPTNENSATDVPDEMLDE